MHLMPAALRNLNADYDDKDAEESDPDEHDTIAALDERVDAATAQLKSKGKGKGQYRPHHAVRKTHCSTSHTGQKKATAVAAKNDQPGPATRTRTRAADAPQAPVAASTRAPRRCAVCRALMKGHGKGCQV